MCGSSRLLAVLLLAGGCAPPVEEPPAPRSPQRIAVMAPAAAETLVALDVAGRVVAVGDFVSVAGRSGLPRLGAYDLPNAERLVELDVDLLLTSASEAGRGEHARLAALGIDVVALDTATFAGALESIREIGRRTGREAEAAALVATIEERSEAVRARVAGSARPRVLVAVGRDPLYVAGPGSHLDELVEIAGGENVAGDSVAAGDRTLGAYQMASFEAMVARRPEVIVDSADGGTGPYGRLVGDWSRWPFLPAVAANRVYHVAAPQLLVPGPRLGEMAERMARFVHPELFGEPSAGDFAAPADRP